MTNIVILICLLFTTLSINAYSEIQEIHDWIKHDAVKLKIQNKFNEYSLMHVLENLSKQGIIKNTVTKYLIYNIPERGEITPVNFFGQINEHGKSGLVSLEIFKPDDSKEILRTPLLQTGANKILTIPILTADDDFVFRIADQTLTIDDYDEDIIKKFNGFSNQNGYFTFS